MFWRRKDGNKPKIEQSRRPPVEELEGFIEWLLRFGADFEEYRQVVRGSRNAFITSYTQIVAKDVADCADEASLTARIGEVCGDYLTNFKSRIDTAGALQNLPSHLFDKALPLLVRARALTYVRQHRYQAQPTDEMLQVLGRLNDI